MKIQSMALVFLAWALQGTFLHAATETAPLDAGNIMTVQVVPVNGAILNSNMAASDAALGSAAQAFRDEGDQLPPMKLYNGSVTPAIVNLQLPVKHNVSQEKIDEIKRFISENESPRSDAAKDQPTALGAVKQLHAVINQANPGTGRIEAAITETYDQTKPAAGAEIAVDQAGIEGSAENALKEGRLQPAAPNLKAEAAPESTPYDKFAGIWRAVSRKNASIILDTIKVTASKNGVGIQYGVHWRYGDDGFNNVNQPETIEHWRGTLEAPGGRQTIVSSARFENGKLESKTTTTETHWVRFPTRIVQTHSFEIVDGRLVEKAETALYRRTFFYFGPYDTRTTINTTNWADPVVRPEQTTVYERVGAASAGAASSVVNEQSLAAAPEAKSKGNLFSSKLAIMMTAALTAGGVLLGGPAFASGATAVGSAISVGLFALGGAALGGALLGGYGYLKASKDARGDWASIAILGTVLWYGGIGAVAGAIGGAMLGAAVSGGAAFAATTAGAPAVQSAAAVHNWVKIGAAALILGGASGAYTSYYDSKYKGTKLVDSPPRFTSRLEYVAFRSGIATIIGGIVFLVAGTEIAIGTIAAMVAVDILSKMVEAHRANRLQRSLRPEYRDMPITR